MSTAPNASSGQISIKTVYRNVTHILAAGTAAVYLFSFTDVGKALVGQYPITGKLFALAATLVALYHIPVKKVFLVLLLCVGLVFAPINGCNAAEWITTAENDLPVVVDIATSILNIADVAAVPAAVSAGAQAKTDLALAQQLVTQFKAGDSGTTLSAVTSALTAVNSDFSAILNAVHISNPAKQATLTAAVGVALSTLLAIESLIPASAASTTSVAAAVRASVAKAAVSKPPSASSIKSKYNTIVKGQYPGAVIK